MADLAYYCPVSNLLFLCKVVERLEAKQLQVFLEDASILDSFQSVFCPGYGMETELVTLTDDL